MQVAAWSPRIGPLTTLGSKGGRPEFGTGVLSEHVAGPLMVLPLMKMELNCGGPDVEAVLSEKVSGPMTLLSICSSVPTKFVTETGPEMWLSPTKSPPEGTVL